MRRYPMPMPFGWFQVAYPEDVEPGTATALRYWSTDLVLWRAEGGDFHLQDAYCPHLDAHLGVGGKVIGATLECPFHGWTFNGEGSCVKIPYSDKVNRKARLRTYPVVVRNGMVMAWRHPDEIEPQWEIPEMEMLCQHLETSGGQLIVDDVRTESDFASHPLLAELDVHAYAGWHVPDRDGRPIGILAATADRPRVWSSADLTTLMERAHACGPALAAALASGVVRSDRAG